VSIGRTISCLLIKNQVINKKEKIKK